VAFEKAIERLKTARETKQGKEDQEWRDGRATAHRWAEEKATEKELRRMGEWGNQCPKNIDALFFFITGANLSNGQEQARQWSYMKKGPEALQERERLTTEEERFFKEVLGVDMKRFLNNDFSSGFFDGAREVWLAVQAALDKPPRR
jgi:hypothetical protein